MAETTNNTLGPQPDFIRMSELHGSLADEMSKIPNTPQFDAGNAIVQALHRIETKIDSLETKVNSLETKVNSLETKVNSLETKVNSLGIEVNGLKNEVNEVKNQQRSR
jgi:peptidoglycan hydrolase CwlO-like protein